MELENDKTWTRTPFLYLLSDAIDFALSSKEKSHDSLTLRSRLSRAAILNSVFALESAANCFIDKMNLSRSMYEAIERMRILEKFEFILLVKRPEANLDKGSTVVQAVADLVSLRNNYAHPKVIKFPLILDESQTEKTQFKVEEKLSKLLRIPLNPDYWDHNHAEQAIKSVIAFLTISSSTCAL